MEEVKEMEHEVSREPDHTPPHHPHHSPPPARRTRKVIIVVAVLLIGGLGGAFFWSRGAARHDEAKAAKDGQAAKAPETSLPRDVAIATEEQLRQITVEPVTERTLEVERETTGKVAFNEERMTPVFTPYAGRVIEVKAAKGAVVQQGQPLLVIESPELVAAQNDLVAARSDESKARITLDAAQKSADRARRLHEREALATKDLQQAEADLARANDELRRAEAARAVVENRLALFGKNSKELMEAGNQGDGNLDRRVVTRAPISGTIVERKVGLGQYIKPDLPDPLFMISDLSTVWVMADVYESYLASIRVGQPVEITVPAYPGRTFPARISFINPTVDAATRTVRVRCLVPNAGGLLKPDMFAKIKIGAAAPQPVPVVPTSAIITQGAEALVFVEEAPGRFRRRPVKAGRDTQGSTVIEEGLKAGERVATRGVLLLNGLIGGGGTKE